MNWNDLLGWAKKRQDQHRTRRQALKETTVSNKARLPPGGTTKSAARNILRQKRKKAP